MDDLTDRLQRALGATYRLERELVGGGMSRVFLATEVQLARLVVVKVLPPETTAAVQTERFAREIQVAASLQHPHIVPLLTAGSGDGLAWYVMPFIEGESLAARLSREGALPVNEALRILQEVIDALAYSHSHGVVHRDIKPDNVMLAGKHALVTDFGVAKAVSASGAGPTGIRTGSVAIGTPTYMAPEQATADPHVDHRADLYSVGAMAYEVLAGRPPFTAATPQAMLAAHVTSYPDHITLHRPSLPPLLASAVMKCLEKMPADRWQNAADLNAVLEAVSTPVGGMTPLPLAGHGIGTNSAARAYRRAAPARVATWFALATIAVIAAVYGATRLLGLPDWVWIGAAVLMAIGFPIVMYTSRVERKRVKATSGGGFQFIAPTKAHHDWFTWRRSIMGGVVALAALAFAAAGYATARAFGIGPAGTLLSSGVFGSEDRFVLADLRNLTTDPGLGTSITEALRVDLGQSRVVRILSEREVATALTRMTLPVDVPLIDSIAMEVARREGAKAVITGEVTPVGTGYVLTARVLEATNGETRAAVRATAADEGHLLPALNELSAQLRERIGESLRSIRASEPLELVTTPSLDALQHYSIGSRVFVHGDFDAARIQLEQAIAADSEFAMAWRKFAVVLFNTGAPRTQMIAATRRAFELRGRLTPLERHLTEAFYYTNAEPDPERTISAYRAALEIDPREPAALNNLTLTLNGVERFAEAEAVGRLGVAATKTRVLYQNLSDALTAQGKWAANDSLARAAVRLEVPGEVPAYILASGAELARDYERLDSVLGSLPQNAPTRSEQETRTYFVSELAFARGRYGAALAATDALAAEKAAGGDLGYALDLALGHALESVLYDRDPAASRRQIAALLRRYPWERIAPGDRPYGNLGWLHARLGDAEATHRLRREFEAAIPMEERTPGQSEEWDEREAWARGDLRSAITANRIGRSVAHCAHCGLYREAELWDRLGYADSALVTLERATSTIAVRDAPDDAVFLAPGHRRLGELYETRGDFDRARQHYGRFVDLWRTSDARFQPAVTAARQRLNALGPDRPRQP